MILGKHPPITDLAAYVDGELHSASAAYIRQHLAVCPDCAQKVQRQAQATALLQQVRYEPTPGETNITPILQCLQNESRAMGIHLGADTHTSSSWRRVCLALTLVSGCVLLYATQLFFSSLVAQTGQPTRAHIAPYVENHVELVDFYEAMSAM